MTETEASNNSQPVKPDFSATTLIDDALAIRSELIRQIEYGGKTVVVAMHSYGGLVGSEAIPEELTYAKRHALSLPGKVIYLFFIAAFMLSEGQSVMSNFGESPNNDVRPDGRFYFLGGKVKLYNDLPDSEASLWASRLIPQSHKVQTTEITRAAWRYIPSTYLVTENDQAVPTQYQEAFAAGAKSRIERIGTGHSPQLSQPEMLAGRIHAESKRAMTELVDGK
ncbi:dipeptidyl-aminopeptidase B [Physcia stellaris]|nr:dipeptidyl-aminopeptidase B [Physcia stellaris]